MKKLVPVLIFTLSAGLALGQSKFIRCYSDERLKEEIRYNPERGKSLEALDSKVDAIVAARQAKLSTGNYNNNNTGRTNTVYIPVVVNIVYNTPEENISDRQIQSQIDVLNEDFSATNKEIKRYRRYNFAGYYDIVADFKIQFCLNTVVRTYTTVTSWGTNNAVKRTSSGGQDPLNPGTMLNIWVCNLGSNLLGYAQFPNGAENVDGVVILYSAFGTKNAGATADPYDYGRTATHEIGHWLGLYHTFQGGCNKQNDKVDDTPPTAGPTFGCPGTGYMSTCKPAQLVQYMNYMDYTEDLCMYMFTQGQMERVEGYISAARAPYCLSACPTASVARSVKANKSGNPGMDNNLLVYPTITRDFTNVIIQSKSIGKAEVTVISQSGSILNRQFIGLAAGKTNFKLNVGNLSGGLYFVRVTTPDGITYTRKLIIQH